MGPVYLLNPIEMKILSLKLNQAWIGCYLIRSVFDKPITVCTIGFCQSLTVSSYCLTALIYTVCVIMNESKTSRLNLTVIACFNIFSNSSLRPNRYIFGYGQFLKLNNVLKKSFMQSMINYDFEIKNIKNVFVLIFFFLLKNGIVSKKKLIKIALKF